MEALGLRLDGAINLQWFRICCSSCQAACSEEERKIQFQCRVQSLPRTHKEKTESCHSQDTWDGLGRPIVSHIRFTLHGNVSWSFYYCRLTGCGRDWCLYQASCYHYGQYIRTYLQAELSCQIIGGHLVEIQSEQENRVVSQMARNHIVWIGYNDRAKTDHWIWTSTGKDGTFTKWGVPPDQANNGYKCAGQSEKFWWRLRCLSGQRFVCEKGMSHLNESKWFSFLAGRSFVNAREWSDQLVCLCESMPYVFEQCEICSYE